MKALFTLLIAFSISSVANKSFAQTDFEGRITFKQTFKINDKKISKKRLEKVYGKKLISYIKEGYYCQISPDAEVVTKVIYRPDDNKWYMMIAGKDTLFYYDGHEDTSKLQSAEITEGTKNIMGYQCTPFVMVFEDKKTTYWFTRDLYKNPEHFANHKLFYYNIFAEKTCSIYLQSMIESKLFDSEATAIEVVEEAIDDDIFLLPPFPLKKL